MAIFKGNMSHICENISLEKSAEIAKFPYIHFQLLGAPTSHSDLEGDECAVNISFQLDCYSNVSASDAYRISEESHKVLKGILMCDRNFGPEFLKNADSAIRRVTSRYSRIFTGEFTKELEEWLKENQTEEELKRKKRAISRKALR